MSLSFSRDLFPRDENIFTTKVPAINNRFNQHVPIESVSLMPRGYEPGGMYQNNIKLHNKMYGNRINSDLQRATSRVNAENAHFSTAAAQGGFGSHPYLFAFGLAGIFLLLMYFRSGTGQLSRL